MGQDIIRLDIAQNVATITMNRPETHNAFDEHMILALDKVFTTLHDRNDLYAVVLRGAGKSFSAGADLGWMKRAAGFSEQQNKADALALAAMLHKLNTLPQVTIACVQGAAFGGGLGLVACCDIVIADESAKFALSEVRLGLIPATIAPYVLRALGERQCRRYFQTAERFDAIKAKELGLVHELVDDHATLEAELQSMLGILSGNGPHAMAAAKRLCLDLSGKEIDPALMEDTAMRIARTRAGAEAKEGLDAFLEKRQANWRAV